MLSVLPRFDVSPSPAQLVVLAFPLLMTACPLDHATGPSSLRGDAWSQDSSSNDAGVADGAQDDGAQPDTTTLDAARSDAVRSDSWQSGDASVADGNRLDVTTPDGARLDSASIDVAVDDAAQDSGIRDASQGDSVVVADLVEVRFVLPSADVALAQEDVLQVVVDVTPSHQYPVHHVDLQVNQILVASDSSVPYEYTYVVPIAASNGDLLRLMAVAYDENNVALGVSPQRIVEVTNTLPTALFTAVASGLTGVQVDASGSSDAETMGANLQVRWDFDSDGTWDTQWSTDKSATHDYQITGTYSITLEVRDNIDQRATATKSIDLQQVMRVSGHLTADTSWHGIVVLEDTVTVDSGVTLTIAGGTQVLAEYLDSNNDGQGDVALLIEGTLALTADALQPVLFGVYPTDQRRPGGWRGVRIDHAPFGDLAHVVVEHAVLGVHLKDTSISTLLDWTVRYNLEAGLVVDDALSLTLQDVRALENNGVGLQLGSEFSSTIEVIGGIVSDNAGHGVSILGRGVGISGTLVTANGGDGIHIVNVLGITIETTEVSNNSGHGVYTDGAGIEIFSSTLVGNGGDGLHSTVSGEYGYSNGLEFEDCTITHNAGNGVYQVDGDLRVDFSTLLFNEKNGVYHEQGDRTLIRWSDLKYNNHSGVLVLKDRTEYCDDQACDTLVQDSNLFANTLGHANVIVSSEDPAGADSFRVEGSIAGGVYQTAVAKAPGEQRLLGVTHSSHFTSDRGIFLRLLTADQQELARYDSDTSFTKSGVLEGDVRGVILELDDTAWGEASAWADIYYLDYLDTTQDNVQAAFYFLGGEVRLENVYLACPSGYGPDCLSFANYGTNAYVNDAESEVLATGPR